MEQDQKIGYMISVTSPKSPGRKFNLDSGCEYSVSSLKNKNMELDAFDRYVNHYSKKYYQSKEESLSNSVKSSHKNK